MMALGPGWAYNAWEKAGESGQVELGKNIWPKIVNKYYHFFLGMSPMKNNSSETIKTNTLKAVSLKSPGCGWWQKKWIRWVLPGLRINITTCGGTSSQAS